MKSDPFKPHIRIHTNGLHNYLWSIIFNDLYSVHYRIIVRDIYGRDHEIYNKERVLARVPSERHLYHIRYHVKIKEPILFIRLERIDYETGDWLAVSGLDFMGEYARNQFKPGWYTLFDTFRWADAFESQDNEE